MDESNVKGVDVSSIGIVTIEMFLYLLSPAENTIVIFDGDPEDANCRLFTDEFETGVGPNETYLDIVPKDLWDRQISQIYVDDFGNMKINVGEKVRLVNI